MTDQQAEAQDFIAKWQRRWPEWAIAEAFVPASQRHVVHAWLALQDELAQAVWGGEDPTPGLAKLAWWHEELEGWARGGRRHPLGALLQRQPAPWSTLARALPLLPSTRGQEIAAAQVALAPLADALDACEAALFSQTAGQGGRVADGASALALLASRALLTGSRDDAHWVDDRWPQYPGGSAPTRLHRALLHGRLRAMKAGKGGRPLPGWRVLGTSWRAVRRG